LTLALALALALALVLALALAQARKSQFHTKTLSARNLFLEFNFCNRMTFNDFPMKIIDFDDFARNIFDF
jgi:hypothetical protein